MTTQKMISFTLTAVKIPNDNFSKDTGNRFSKKINVEFFPSKMKGTLSTSYPRAGN